MFCLLNSSARRSRDRLFNARTQRMFRVENEQAIEDIWKK